MTTLADRVKNHVLDAITKGKFQIGQVLPDSEVIAGQVKCSTGTVRKALTDLANEGVLKRIQRRGTVVARKPSTGHVCLMLPPDSHMTLLLHDVVHSALVSAGYEVDTVPTTMGKEAVRAHCDQLLSSPNLPNCLVALEPGRESWPMVEEFAKLATRRVVFQFDSAKVFQHSALVTFDQQRAAREVVQYLLKLGHRKISVVSGFAPGDSGWSVDVASHCRDLLEVAGAEFIPHYLGDGHTKLIHKFEKERVTAYWGVTDHEVMQVLNHCYQHGVRIPQDVSLIGRNDTPWARDCRPPLTTVSMNAPAIAEALVESLNAQITDPSQTQRVIKVHQKLVIRESTGPLKTK